MTEQTAQAAYWPTAVELHIPFWYTRSSTVRLVKVPPSAGVYSLFNKLSERARPTALARPTEAQPRMIVYTFVVQMQQSTNSATDTRKGRLEDSRTEGMSKQAKSNEGVTQQHVHAQKRQSCDQDAEKSVKNANAEVRDQALGRTPLVELWFIRSAPFSLYNTYVKCLNIDPSRVYRPL